MSDFTLIQMKGNHGTQAAPIYVAMTEVRWCNSNVAHDVAEAAWPAMIRPGVGTAPVPYTYAYTAAAVGHGFISNNGAANTPAFTHANFLWAQWDWDDTGTFASGPIFTAYPSIAHANPTPNDGTLLGGKIADTGGAGFSYLKGEAYGQVDSVAIPAAEPTLEPVVTDGTVGVISPAAGANWIGAFQDLQGDLDWILAPFTPIPVTADQWSIMFALFTGVNMIPNLYLVVMSLKYTWT